MVVVHDGERPVSMQECMELCFWEVLHEAPSRIVGIRYRYRKVGTMPGRELS